MRQSGKEGLFSPSTTWVLWIELRMSGLVPALAGPSLLGSPEGTRVWRGLVEGWYLSGLGKDWLWGKGGRAGATLQGDLGDLEDAT